MNDKVEKTVETAGEIVLYQPDEKIRLDVKLDSSTVWLSIDQMATLFCRDRSVIGKHIRAIFKEGELVKNSVWAKFAYTAGDGKSYQVDFYNLDVIISVGYRVHSIQGTHFRIWATNVLKQHLLQGYSINAQLVALQERMDGRISGLEHRMEKQEEQVEFLVDMHRQPSEMMFPTGCVFDAWEYGAGLVRKAKFRIILVDNYCDERTLMLLSKRQLEVECTIYTRFNEAFDVDLEKHNRQYPAIKKVQLSQKEHDRFLIIDDTVYILGDSLKDLGHSMTAVLKTSFTVEEILVRLRN